MYGVFFLLILIFLYIRHDVEEPWVDAESLQVLISIAASECPADRGFLLCVFICRCCLTECQAGVLLIIVRGYRWLKVDWLVLVLVAMVAPLRPRTTDRWSSLSGLRLRSSNHRSP